jgi:CRP-like cAMP-binding protein
MTTTIQKTIEAQPEPRLEDVSIIQYISQFMNLSAVEAEAVIDSLNPRQYKKGDFLLKEGQYAELCYFVLKGCVRHYYLTDGEEKTTHFYTEGQPISAYQGSFKRAASKFYLACVEDSVVSIGSFEDEQKLYNQFPRLEKISRIAVEEELANSHESLANFIMNSPEERYLDLLNNRPDLLDRVPHYQLASD